MKFEILNSAVTESNTDSICIPYYKNNDKNTDLNSANKSIDNILNDLEERKQIEFSEKIDELNQETDTLLDEIDKWQM